MSTIQNNQRSIFFVVVLGFFISTSPLTELPLRSPSWTPPVSYKLGQMVTVPDQPDLYQMRLNGRRMSYLAKQKIWLGVAPQGNVALHFFWNGKNGSELSEAIVRTDSVQLERADKLRLPASVWEKVSDTQSAERIRDRKIMSDVMNRFSNEINSSCWKLPLNSRITSPFGSPRRLPNGHAYYHSGEDRRAAIGTKIQAAGHGTVVFAGEMVVPGKNVIIDHGGGLFTRYLHFSETKVQSGDVVASGQIIGRSGATGRVEAPHLHWEIVWKGIAANPQYFLQAWAHLCDPT